MNELGTTFGNWTSHTMKKIALEFANRKDYIIGLAVKEIDKEFYLRMQLPEYHQKEIRERLSIEYEAYNELIFFDDKKIVTFYEPKINRISARKLKAHLTYEYHIEIEGVDANGRI